MDDEAAARRRRRRSALKGTVREAIVLQLRIEAAAQAAEQRRMIQQLFPDFAPHQYFEHCPRPTDVPEVIMSDDDDDDDDGSMSSSGSPLPELLRLLHGKFRQISDETKRAVEATLRRRYSRIDEPAVVPDSLPPPRVFHDRGSLLSIAIWSLYNPLEAWHLGPPADDGDGSWWPPESDELEDDDRWYRNGGFGAVPASADAVAGLPSRTVSAADVEAARDKEDRCCAVCLEAYEEGDTVRQMPCAHGFHDGCILGWLAVSRACPLCRFMLPPAQAKDDDRAPPN